MAIAVAVSDSRSALVKSNLHPVKVYVVVRTDVVEQDRQLKLAVPLLPTQEYDMKLLYLAGTIVADESLDLKLAKAGELVLQSREIQVPTVEAAKSQALQADIQPKPAIFK